MEECRKNDQVVVRKNGRMTYLIVVKVWEE
jgi:hypothetical protein